MTLDEVRRLDPGVEPSVTTKLRELLGAATTDGRTVASLLAEVILSKALGGDIRFMTELLNRTEGKAPDHVQQPTSPTVLHWEEEDAIALIYGGKSVHPEARTTEMPEG